MENVYKIVRDFFILLVPLLDLAGILSLKDMRDSALILGYLYYYQTCLNYA